MTLMEMAKEFMEMTHNNKKESKSEMLRWRPDLDKKAIDRVLDEIDPPLKRE